MTEDAGRNWIPCHNDIEDQHILRFRYRDAVKCSAEMQYAIRYLVDTKTAGIDYEPMSDSFYDCIFEGTE